jgi:hypothetical protein
VRIVRRLEELAIEAIQSGRECINKESLRIIPSRPTHLDGSLTRKDLQDRGSLVKPPWYTGRTHPASLLIEWAVPGRNRQQ